MDERELSRGSEVVRALRDGGLLNADKTLGEIVQAAQKIPSLSESGLERSTYWVFITREFIYKGGTNAAISAEDIRALRDAEIINFDLTLGKLLDIAQRLPTVPGDTVPWELISRDFIMRGSPPPNEQFPARA